MAISDYEESEKSGQPVFLFEFIYGPDAGDVIRFSDSTEEVVHDGKAYTPEPIEKGAIKTEGRPGTDELTIRVPRSSPLAAIFNTYPPIQPVTLTIRQGHIPNPGDPSGWASGNNFPVTWTGTITESSRSGAVMELSGEAISVSMRRPGLRKNYQRMCPLRLYGSRCLASKAAATTTATLASSPGATDIQLSTPWLPGGITDVNKYVGGLVEWAVGSGAEVRTILRVSNGDTLYLSGPVRNLSNGDQVSVILGCAHDIDDCENLHANIQNFGGQPFIPTENPVNRNTHI